MSDPLEASIRALRDRASRDPVDVDGTRSRVLRSMARRERSRRLALAGSIALALVVTNSTTWAWFTGRLPSALAAMSRSLDRATAREETEPAPRETARQATAPEEHADARFDDHAEPASSRPIAEPRALPAADPHGAPVGSDAPLRSDPRLARPAGERPDPELSIALRADPVGRAAELHRAPRDGAALADALETGAASAPATDEPAPEATLIDSRDREAFGAAHALHFGGDAPADALAAWERYLADFPEGRFRPEAAWNRAICLVRLEHRDAARAALEPFARGAHGGLRQRDAALLLEALSRE